MCATAQKCCATFARSLPIGLLRFPTFTQYSQGIHSYSQTIRKLFALFASCSQMFSYECAHYSHKFASYSQSSHQFTAVNTRYLYSSIVLPRKRFSEAQIQKVIDEKN